MVLATALFDCVFGCAPVKDGHYLPAQSVTLSIESSDGILPAQVDVTTIRFHYVAVLPASSELPVQAKQPGAGRIEIDGSSVIDFGEASPAETLLGMVPMLVVGSVTGVPDYLLVATPASEWTTSIVAGGSEMNLHTFGLFRRTCPELDHNLVEPVDLGTTLVYDPAVTAAASTGRDLFLERCGHVALPADVGDLVATLSGASNDGSYLWVTDLAFAPGADAIYVLAGPLGKQGVDLFRWKAGDAAAARLASGDFYGPIALATGGTSALFNDLHIDLSPVSGGRVSSGRVKKSLVDGNPILATIPGDAPWPPEADSQATLLSPDGTTLATATDGELGTSTELVDVSSGAITVATLGRGTPLAWAPDGGALLVETAEGGFEALSLDGETVALADPFIVEPTSLLAYGDHQQLFWTAAGPGAIHQSSHGTSVQLFPGAAATQLVEANRVPPPSAQTAAVVTTSQVFAWAMDCAGVGWTSCNGELRRLSLVTGQVDVVARAPTAMRFAVSLDGTKLALSDGVSLYLKTLP